MLIPTSLLVMIKHLSFSKDRELSGSLLSALMMALEKKEKKKRFKLAHLKALKLTSRGAKLPTREPFLLMIK